MMDNKFREVPGAMKSQAEEGKKDRYIELTAIVNATDYSAATAQERIEFMNALLDTLEYMDFQIYELYRSVLDKLRMCLSETACMEISDAEKAEIGKIIEKSAKRSYVNLEGYGFLMAEVDFDKRKELPFEVKNTISVKNLCTSARFATFEIENVGMYETDEEYLVYINGNFKQKVNTSVFTLFGLKPQHEFEVVVTNADNTKTCCVKITTKYESVTLNVKDFGAKGDGESDDTSFIQAAILSCPKNGRVLIEDGVYRITSLFLRSHVNVELAKGAELKAIPDRALYSKQPYAVMSTNGKEEFHLGTWEGNPLPMFTGVMTGIDVENCALYGEGTLNGAASKENWWHNPKVMVGAYRPRLFFLNGCENVALVGLTLKNSPAWTIHPFFSDKLKFYNLTVLNPADSPNTDGLDPESCKHVEIAGVKFSLGDDCIAVKAGKIYMGRKYKTPSEDIRIHHCLMENGHGAVTIGSEMAGGVKDLSVEDCVFSHTDRGLRIKTRRGRGKDAILDNIAFRRIEMDNVMTPFVANSFYFCDPDGKTDYVQSREYYPVDERTPFIKKLVFEDINARSCHVAAAYLEGLPERKIEEIVMRRIRVDYSDNPKCDVPAMSSGVEACTKKGVFAKNVAKMVIDDVIISGCEGKDFDLIDVEEIQNGQD